MGKIVVTEFVSLDGVVEDPGGVEGFEYGGWVFEFSQGDDGVQFKLGEALASEAMLLGRTTYETFAASWPSRDGEWADKLNSMPKYVVSSTLTKPAWTNTTVVSGNLGDVVAKVNAAHDGEIVVHGSTQLARALLEHDLVDELRLMVFPVVLGRGTRLFGETSSKKPLRLIDARLVGDGVTILIYVPTREGDSDARGLEAARAESFRRAGIGERS
jgi:dihydrofolate reductase